MSARDASSLQAHASVLGLSQLTCFFPSNGLGSPPMPVFHQKVTAYIASLPSPQKEICQSLRELILENFPQAPTPRRSAVCYYVDRANRPNQQTFCCRVCGYSTHADLNRLSISNILGETSDPLAISAGRNTGHGTRRYRRV